VVSKEQWFASVGGLSKEATLASVSSLVSQSVFQEVLWPNFCAQRSIEK
jgi:hypothetical protein